MLENRSYVETPATPPAVLGATASATDLPRGILLHTLGLAAAGLALGLAGRGFWRARWDACCSAAYGSRHEGVPDRSHDRAELELKAIEPWHGHPSQLTLDHGSLEYKTA